MVVTPGLLRWWGGPSREVRNLLAVRCAHKRKQGGCLSWLGRRSALGKRCNRLVSGARA